MRCTTCGMHNFTTLDAPVFESVHSTILVHVCGGCKHGKSPGKQPSAAPAMTGKVSDKAGDPAGAPPQIGATPSAQPPGSTPSADLLSGPLASLSQAIQSVQQALGQMGGGGQP